MAELDLLKVAVERLGCPEWPDCGDDEGPCFACAQAKAIVAALEDRERLRAAARGGMARGRWEHAYDCGELGPMVSTRACTCGLATFRAALEGRDD